MTAVAAPAFLPDHPDAEILEAFRDRQALSLKIYDLDQLVSKLPGGSDDAAQAIEQVEHVTAELAAADEMVMDNFATTPAGIAAQLMLLLKSIEHRPELDVAMAHGNWAKIVTEKNFLSWQGKSVLGVIDELQELEWAIALERMHAEHDRWVEISGIYDLLEQEVVRLTKDGQEPTPFLAAMKAHVDQISTDASETFDQSLDALIATPAPCWVEYKRKIQLAQEHDVADKAAPYLLRDVELLAPGATSTPAQRAA